METVWIFGDQLNRRVGALANRGADDARVLIVESDAKIRGRRWHRQRLHLYLTAMRRFAEELEAEGFEVDYRRAASFAAGLREHHQRYSPDRVVAMSPTRWGLADRLRSWDVEVVDNDQFLCSAEEFRDWAEGRKQLRMEHFYRWQRKRHGILMDGDEPEGGRWNFDEENREPPPPDGEWPVPARSELGEVDRDVLAEIEDIAFGAEPAGWWPTTRRAALARLRHFTDECLPRFGPHQDAMTMRSWHLAHSLLSPALNVGMLHPREICEAVEEAYRAGRVPIASAEGFIRQVIGWREFVWGVYWLWMPEYRGMNELVAENPLLPCFDDPSRTEMACVRSVVSAVHERGWAHHIERLMLLANISLLCEVRPQALLDWMERAFVDAAEWVMVPNVIGMGLHADGGRMASKPYASGGAYVNRMSDFCADCRFDPKARTGDDACPFTSLYWGFVERNRDRLERNPRTSMSVRSLDRLEDKDETLGAAERVRDALVAGKI